MNSVVWRTGSNSISKVIGEWEVEEDGKYASCSKYYGLESSLITLWLLPIKYTIPKTVPVAGRALGFLALASNDLFQIQWPWWSAAVLLLPCSQVRCSSRGDHCQFLASLFLIFTFFYSSILGNQREGWLFYVSFLGFGFSHLYFYHTEIPMWLFLNICFKSIFLLILFSITWFWIYNLRRN